VTGGRGGWEGKGRRKRGEGEEKQGRGLVIHSHSVLMYV